MGREPVPLDGGRVRTWIVHPVLSAAGPRLRDEAGRIAEIRALAASIDLDVGRAESVRVARPRPATLVGPGFLERLAGDAREADGPPGLYLFNADLTPVQQRNLERALEAKVLDRTSLILEIFGARAASREGRLQVELAHLQWQQSRLVRSWTHLERQRGGYGFLGGPGESQIEIDRRLIARRIARIRTELERVRGRRGLHRRSRSLPQVALVGYTNAGKSTLFNRLAGEATDARAMPFATLDPLMRTMALPSGGGAILSDTVGFVSELPTFLVAAFRATLEEVVHADLLVHVRDAAHPESAAQRADVMEVLDGLMGEGGGPPVIEALNKTDLLDGGGRAGLAGRGVPISAVRGEGIDRLRGAIAAALGRARREYEIDLPAGDGSTLAWLHRRGAVLGQKAGADSMRVRVRLDPAERRRLDAKLAGGASPAKGGSRLDAKEGGVAA